MKAGQMGNDVPEAMHKPLRLKFLPRIALVCLYAVILFWLGRNLHWGCDLLTHTLMHCWWFACGLLAYFAVTKQWRWGAMSVVWVLGVGAIVLPASGWFAASADSSVVASGTDIRVLTWNTFVGNQDIENTAADIDAADADIIVIVEWTPAMRNHLAALRAEYPYRMEVPGQGAFGIALYSKVAGKIDTVLLPGDVSSLRFRAADPEIPIEVWAVHMLPPIGDRYWRFRNEQLAEIAGHLEKRSPDRQAIVCGDLNVTPWSGHFQTFLERSGCNDSREGHGYQASWPRRLGRLGIPIDHCLVDPRLQVIDRKIGFSQSANGSDHGSVLLTIRVRP
ncbi:Endonuclease/Exonuclease/phosphatase family protein [Roseimaritima multifibrata]|uniref:Endonuclease/Exonuclease/phosphatase family protein n=2 Tax=Roseimaritima multifibrata TaxID=1930274 RepID=A0A517MEB9_9BACT|nr:Endonuclease/Exonuclease/phosphatase family protein [Roseimaritima multifibrata]